MGAAPDSSTVFRSFFLGGFECSTHRVRDGRRLDMIAATRHDELALNDYQRLSAIGIRAARDGFRWHLVDRGGGRLGFSSALPLIRAARTTGVQVIWDLCHYGWPDDLDVLSPEFVDRFARFAGEAAGVVAAEVPGTPFFLPINEMGYLAWAGGDTGYLNPFLKWHDRALKRQLVRAAIAAMDAIWSVTPDARMVTVEPRTHLAPRHLDDPAHDRHREWECEVWDMLAGRFEPELGGSPRYLDIVGINYFPSNQFHPDGTQIEVEDPAYRPLRDILLEVAHRYGRPTFVGETCATGERRGPWLRYVAAEVRAARLAGAAVEGICLYPIVDHPGWDHGEPWEVGMWSYPDEQGRRAIHLDYAQQLRTEIAAQEDR
ncbi:MAG: beta-glucosidase [Chloroflexi bacterium]|nr:beta-glucosidase [Chloroflexota bacterium]